MPTLADILSPMERSILIYLSQGKHYDQVATMLNLRMPCFYVHCQHLRQKTGIKSTRSHEECRAYVKNIRSQALEAIPVIYRPPLSYSQLEVLRGIASGDDYPKIGRTLNMGPQTVQNHATAACKRAGIKARGHHARLAAIKQYIVERDGPDQVKFEHPAPAPSPATLPTVTADPMF